MMKQSLLLADRYIVNDRIAVINPVVGDVLRDEREYYANVSLLCATPYSLMGFLWKQGIDYESISEFDLFCMLMVSMKDKDLSLVFDGISAQALQPIVHSETEQMLLYDQQNDIAIDQSTANDMVTALRKINGFQKDTGHAGNAAGKEYLLDKAIRKIERDKRKPYKPHLESLVISLVNNRDFPYDYDGALNLSLYRLNSSVPQIQRLKNFEQTMSGVYAGTVNAKSIDLNKISWL